MVHPHENKKIHQEASLAKQESRDTSSTKKCKYVWGARAGYREEKINTAKAYRGRVKEVKIPLVCKKCQGQWMLLLLH